MMDKCRLEKEGFGTEVKDSCVAVYALLSGGVVVYVCGTRNLWYRLGEHYATRKRRKGRGSTKLGRRWTESMKIEFDEILIRYCYENELKAAVSDLVERYRPKYNLQINPIPSNRLDVSYVVAMLELSRKAKREFVMSRRKL